MGVFEFINKYSHRSCVEKIGLIAIIMIIAIDGISLVHYGCPISENKTIYNPQFRNGVAMTICHCCLVTIIVGWIYSAPRALRWHKESKNLLYHLTREIDNYGNITVNEQNSEVKEVCWRHEGMVYLLYRNTDSGLARIVKTLFIILWVLFIMCLSCLLLPAELHHLRANPQGITTIVVAWVCMWMCMSSWWYSMEHSYYLWKISNLDSANRYNRIHPSQTYALKRFIHVSKLLAIAFFLTSFILAIQYIAVVLLDGVSYRRPLDILWLVLNIVPGLISLVPVVIMPQIFIGRLHRKWKMEVIQSNEEQLNKAQSEEEYQYYADQIDVVANDRIVFRYLETMGVMITILADIGMPVATIIASGV